MIKKILCHIEHLLERKSLNLFWTIYLNFRLLPFSIAIKFPILCYGKIRVRQASGKLLIERISKGQILIGVDKTGYRTRGTTTFSLFKNSTLHVHNKVSLYQGSSLILGENATLTLGDCVTLGDNAEIVCMNNISIGNHCGITWETQITDYASHPIIDMETGKQHAMTSPIYIGDYCWIGNRSTIRPGTKLPSRTIVASYSLLNKDYIAEGVPSYSLLGGIPAKVIKLGIKRIDY